MTPHRNAESEVDLSTLNWQVADPARGPGAAYEVAGWWQRVGASVIDALVMFLPGAALGVLLHAYRVVHYITLRARSGRGS